MSYLFLIFMFMQKPAFAEQLIFYFFLSFVNVD